MNTPPVSTFFGEKGAASDEILVSIYENLPLKKDQLSLARADQRLAKIFPDNAVWKVHLSRDYGFSLALPEGLEKEKTKRFFLQCYRTLVDLPQVIEMKNWESFSYKEIPPSDPEPNGNFLFIHNNSQLKVQNCTDGKEVFSLENVACFNTEGDFLYIRMVGKNQIRILNKDFKEERSIPLNETIKGNFLIYKGKIYAITNENDILIVSLKDPQEIETIRWSQFSEVNQIGTIQSIKIQGKFLLITLGQGGIIFWDLNKSQEVICMQANAYHPTSMGDIAFVYNPNMGYCILAWCPHFKSTPYRIFSRLSESCQVVDLQTVGLKLLASTSDGKTLEFDFSPPDLTP